MKNSISMAMASSMEQIAGNPQINDHVGGKLGKLVKTTVSGAFIAAAMLVSTGAMAQSSINAGCIVGGIAGGLVGHTGGGGNGKNALTALGAVIGCNAGQQVQANSDQRRQQQAGYQQQRAPQFYGNNGNNGYNAPPVVGVHPMGNYMAHAFGQINGQIAPSQPLTAQGQMAMEKALGEAENRMRENNDAQQQYAQAYQQANNLRMSSNNPESQVLMGTQNLRNSEYQAQSGVNRAAQSRNQTNMNFGSAGMRMADLVEYEAAQGYDIRSYGDRIMRVLSAPMSAPVSGFDPATKQNVTFSTAPSSQYQNPQYQQRPQRGAGY